MKLTEHFNSSEFACPCCGKDDIKQVFVAMLEEARVKANRAFNINSGVRCVKHNAEVGGVDSSAHVRGFAADIKINNNGDRLMIHKALMDVGFTRFGIAKTFIHVDCDPDKPNKTEWVY